jgi:hypothetical protein
MATKNQRSAKHDRRAHHNTTNRTSVPNECIARSKRLGVADLEAMKVKDLRELAKAHGITGFSKAKASSLVAQLALAEIRKENADA